MSRNSLETTSNQVEMGLKWRRSTSEATRTIEKQAITLAVALRTLGISAACYASFVEEVRKQGVNTPIVPGIMPITNSTQLLRFSDACGAEVPRWIRLRLQSFGDDRASIQAFGLDVVSDLCERLRAAGVPGLHFYSMNQAAPVKAICVRLGMSDT
jgi:methylenetetrahydrofolate reductase (NADPH)